MNLFNKKILNQRIASFSFPAGEQANNIAVHITRWQKALKDSDLSKTKEKSIQGDFLNIFFQQILGYTRQSSGDPEWTLVAEPKTEVDAQTADGAVGFFNKNENITVGVIELKDAKTSLDKKQKGREKGYSAVEQAYLYATKFDKCKWIIVSNFREIRLYNKSRSEQFFEKFDVLELHKEDEFKKFYFLLSKENLISKDGESPIDDLVKKSEATEEDISKQFYTDYKSARQDLYTHLAELNPTIDKKSLFEKSQKILDRIVFILFCEDTANLLPKNILKDTYQLGVRSRDRSDEKVWREMKNLFIDIDEGRSDIDPKINGYNGGLFKYDEVLDTLIIKDNVWQTIIKLADYDFETDLNVNILGHIFEQSISDIESIKSEIAGEEQDKSKSKRKKDGIFYTPEYITKYIVENTVGKYLEEHPDKLSNIKILDPACGSGAFLNQAHSYLLNEYKVRHEQKMLEKREKGEEMSLFDYNPAEANRAILLNNLYGVDLNDESVEITKLSLWLKTARKDEPLQNLDGNIKAGNSLIDSPEVAGEKAFDWNTQFDSIMKDGGFDVIIGNPPYVKLQNFRKGNDEAYKYLIDNYQTTNSGSFDLYIPFIEKAYKLLKPGGYLAFIAPSVWIFNQYGKALRQFIKETNSLYEFLDFKSFQVFEDATVYTAIQIFKKGNNANFKYYPSPNGDLLDLKGYDIAFNDLDSDSWALSSTSEKQVMKKMASEALALGNQAEILVGVQTSADSIYHLIKTDNGFYSKELNEYVQLEEELLKPLVSGTEIKRYETPNTDKYILYPYLVKNNKFVLIGEEVLQSSFPNAYSYLKKNEVALRAREKDSFDDKEWYRFGRNQNIDKQHFPKIGVAQTVPNLRLAPDFDGKFVFNNVRVNGILAENADKTELAYLLGILNSKAANFYFVRIAKPKDNGFYEANKQFIAPIPIPKADKDQKEKVARLAEQMVTLQTKKRESIGLALNLLESEYSIKAAGAFAELDKLGWNNFSEQLDKQKLKFSLSQKEELQQWYKSKQKQITDLEQDIQKLDRDINNQVYSLYKLTSEEIAIIESMQ